MPYAVKKPHPTVDNVMLYHTWDPDGDGYEEIRKFPDQEKANVFAAEHAGAVVVEIGYEIDQTDEMIAERMAIPKRTIMEYRKQLIKYDLLNLHH